MLNANQTVCTCIDFLNLQVNGELLPSLVYEIEIGQNGTRGCAKVFDLR